MRKLFSITPRSIANDVNRSTQSLLCFFHFSLYFLFCFLTFSFCFSFCFCSLFYFFYRVSDSLLTIILCHFCCCCCGCTWLFDRSCILCNVKMGSSFCFTNLTTQHQLLMTIQSVYNECYKTKRIFPCCVFYISLLLLCARNALITAWESFGKFEAKK